MKINNISLLLMKACLPTCLLFTSGCVINQREQQMQMQQQRSDNEIIMEDLRRMRARIEVMEQDMQRLANQYNSSMSDQTRSQSSQIQGINASLDELQKRIQQVDAAREKDKREIVDSLSKKISAVLSSQSSPRTSSTPRRSTNNEGYEHTVQPGETLSAIAKAYGVRSEDISQANNLKSADMLRVGQKLFVPAP